MKTPQIKAYVIANGIKKRCRKSDRHMIKLGYFNYPVGENSREFFHDLGLAAVDREMKQTTDAKINLDYVEIDKSEAGFHIETWKPFDERHVSIPLTLWGIA